MKSRLIYSSSVSLEDSVLHLRLNPSDQRELLSFLLSSSSLPPVLDRILFYLTSLYPSCRGDSFD